MLGRSIRLARISGISVEIHPSWFLIVAFVAWALATGALPAQYSHWSTTAYWVVGCLGAFFLFVSVLIHELAHAFFARRSGIHVPRITLFIFGGVSEMVEQPATAGAEFRISVAGPATSLVLAAIFGLAAAASGSNEKVQALTAYLALVNLLLGAFNLVPGFPLDGGRVFRSAVWRRTGDFRKATRIAADVGGIVGYGLLAAGFVLLLTGYLLDGLWLMMIGWFLLAAGRGEVENQRVESVLGSLKARDIMRTDFATVVPGVSVETVAHDVMLGQGERAVFVALDGSALGLITVSDVRHVHAAERATTPVKAAMTPRERLVVVNADAGAMETLALLREHNVHQLPVIDGGRMVGVISRAEVIERMQVAQRLQGTTPRH